MKQIASAIFILFACISCLARDNGKTTILFDSINEAKAPAAIQDAMRVIAKAKIDECLAEPEFSKEAGNFFRARRLDLSKTHEDIWLVTPGDSCISVFHGAHSTSFWILSQSREHGFRVLFETQRDGISILPKFTNGYRDLELIYGFDEPVRARYFGNTYVEFSEAR